MCRFMDVKISLLCVNVATVDCSILTIEFAVACFFF